MLSLIKLTHWIRRFYNEKKNAVLTCLTCSSYKRCVGWAMTTNDNQECPSIIQDKIVSMTLGRPLRMNCLLNSPNLVWQVLATNEKTKLFFKCHQAGDYQSKAGRWWFCWYVQILIISNLSITKLKHIFCEWWSKGIIIW